MLLHHRSYGGIKWNYFAFGQSNTRRLKCKQKHCILNSVADNHDSPRAHFFAGHPRMICAFVTQNGCHTTSQQIKWTTQFLFCLALKRVTNNINYIILAKEINYAFSMKIYYSVSRKYTRTVRLVVWNLFKLPEKSSFTLCGCMLLHSLCMCVYGHCVFIRINLGEIEFWNAFRDK